MIYETIAPVLAAAGIHWEASGAFRVPCYRGDSRTEVSYSILVGVSEFAPIFRIPLEELAKDLKGMRIEFSIDSIFMKMYGDRGLYWVLPAIIKSRLELGV
jgi:hypothetical protein